VQGPLHEKSAIDRPAWRPGDGRRVRQTIFYQPDHATTLAHLKQVAGMLKERFPEAAEVLEDAAEDVLAHMQFPKEHRRRLHSTDTVERLHMEIKRRTRVIGIFPNRASLLRMVGTLLQEQDDEWQGRRAPLLLDRVDDQDRHRAGRR
jgi:putative transposase